MTNSNLPPDRNAGYPNKYTPDLLFPIARIESREVLGIGDDIPFRGVDVWNAWELTWLGAGDLPQVATVEIRVPADTPNLIESKSLKLYLNSYSMTRFADVATVARTLATDLSACTGGVVDIRVDRLGDSEDRKLSVLPGLSLDSLAVQCKSWQVDANILQADTSIIVTEALHTHLLRSLCPVTAQPDIGSLALHYSGPKIDHASLLRYVISYREHGDFHEACVERMFVDIQARCKPQKLSIYAHYQRRGGIDINPFRSNFEDCPDNSRLWRQ